MTARNQLDAYASKINLALFADIVAFVMDTAKAGAAQRNVLRRRCPFWPGQPGGAFQEKYGFLYLGEMLERYEERFGMAVPDLRAIALALGYTKELLADEMFVGSQRDDFVCKIRESAGGDVYLAGALHLLDEDRDGSEPPEAILTEAYRSTEDLIFIVSLSDDPGHALALYKSEIVRLLGKERTISVQGNIDALTWLIAWMSPHIKAMRGKDAALPKAICALPVSHVKPESKHHAALLEHSWTPMEIAYANMAAVMAGSVPGTLSRDSLVAEKIAVSLFREALVQEHPLTAETYELLSDLYQEHRCFHIKCYGCEKLDDTLNDVRIQNADIFAWFAGLTDISHSAFNGFDILDSKWDELAAKLKQSQYLKLFELNLSGDMDAGDIRRRISRYDALTSRNYLAIYQEKYAGTQFALMVDKGLIDLWQAFDGSLDDAGEVKYAGMLNNIYGYLQGISTELAYRFYEKFFDRYGTAGLKQFWGYDHGRFFDSLTERRSYGYGYNSNSNIRLKLDRPFLDEDGRRQLLAWLEDYFFTYEPNKYLDLAIALLRDESVAELFARDEQQAMFQIVIANAKAPQGIISELKQRYFTPAELKAEKDAEDAARQEAERQKEADLLQSVAASYVESVNGTLAAAHEFLRKHRYSWKECPLACRVVREHLDGLLSVNNYELDGKDAVRLLHICAMLADNGAMSYSEAQAIIQKAKEREANDEDG